MLERIAELWTGFGNTLFDHTVRWFPRLLAATLVILFFWVLWRIVQRMLTRLLARWSTDKTLNSFIIGTSRGVAVVIALVSVLSQLGINTASLLASLGIAGLTLGFAAKDTLSNVIAGVFIFWDRPFTIGDLVDVDGRYGRVEAITLRSTRVVTPDGKMLAIPNTTVVNTVVASYTNFPNLRLDVAVTIGLEEDLDRARDLLLGIVADDPRFLRDPKPVVVVTALNDYNRALELRAWLVDEKDHIPRRHELRERVYEVLHRAGVEMPYQTFELASVTMDRADSLPAAS